MLHRDGQIRRAAAAEKAEGKQDAERKDWQVGVCMCYADYDYYINYYSGRAIAETDFPRLSRQASAYLDMLTLDKITGDWETDERVKNACCAVADVYAKQDAGGEVASESNHSVSRTYVASGKSTDKQLYDAAVLYLANTGLLYRGVT